MSWSPDHDAPSTVGSARYDSDVAGEARYRAGDLRSAEWRCQEPRHNRGGGGRVTLRDFVSLRWRNSNAEALSPQRFAEVRRGDDVFKAKTQRRGESWIPACAGMTVWRVGAGGVSRGDAVLATKGHERHESGGKDGCGWERGAAPGVSCGSLWSLRSCMFIF